MKVTVVFQTDERAAAAITVYLAMAQTLMPPCADFTKVHLLLQQIASQIEDNALISELSEGKVVQLHVVADVDRQV